MCISGWSLGLKGSDLKHKDPNLPVDYKSLQSEFMVEKFMFEKDMVENFMVEEFMVEEFMVEEFMVEECMVQVRMVEKLGLKLRVEKQRGWIVLQPHLYSLIPNCP